MNKWKLIVLMLCCRMIGVCGKYFYDYFAQSMENKEVYEDIISIGFSDITDNQDEDDPEDETEARDFDYDSLLAINSDCIGWIRIDGTDIDYPVVQVADNTFYLGNQKYNYDVVAVFVANIAKSGSYYNYLHGNTREEQMEYLQKKMAAYQLYDTEVGRSNQYSGNQAFIHTGK